MNKIIYWDCLEEMDKFIEQGIQVDAIICDPPYWKTAWSGNTGVAAKNTNRNYILIEKEEKYIDIINKRLNIQTLF